MQVAYLFHFMIREISPYNLVLFYSEFWASKLPSKRSESQNMETRKRYTTMPRLRSCGVLFGMIPHTKDCRSMIGNMKVKVSKQALTK